MWYGVDPMADKYPNVSVYMYTAGNPVMLVDPDGRNIDWVETTDDKGNKIIKWDENAKKVDGKVVGLKAGDKYLGKTGYGIEGNGEDEHVVYYGADKQKHNSHIDLPETTINGGKMSEHAKTMSNPVVKGIHQAQKGFWNNGGWMVGIAMAAPFAVEIAIANGIKSNVFAAADIITQYSITGDVDWLSVGLNYVPGVGEGKYIKKGFNAFKITTDAAIDVNSKGLEINTGKDFYINLGIGCVNEGIGIITRGVNADIYGKPLLKTITTSSSAALKQDD